MIFGFVVAHLVHHEIGTIYSLNLVEWMVRLEIEMEGIKGGDDPYLRFSVGLGFNLKSNGWKARI